jgi:hypothetical protein
MKGDALPKVLDERATLRLVRDTGCSLARYGDGEGQLCRNRPIKSTPYSSELAARLREVLRSKDRKLLVAIPRIWKPLPERMPRQRELFWAVWRERFTPMLRAKKIYGSSFVSRPDSAPAIDCPEYWALMRSIWAGREVLAVHGGKFDGALLDNAFVTGIRHAEHDAWSEYETIKAHALEWAQWHPGGLVVAFLGPTATILAADCSAAGVQCLDLGSATRWYRDSRRRDARSV